MASSLQQGINAAKAGRMSKALDFLKDAIIEEPQNADVWVWIAAIIDDVDKQEIFLEKALEIDPNNIPAQRGMAYLQKRKHDEINNQDDHLSDVTKPISPFPESKRSNKNHSKSEWAQVEQKDLDKFTHPGTGQLNGGKSKGFFTELPKISFFEIFLLGVVVVVFCFIGLLAASAIFGFELPLDFLNANRPGLSTEPPYSGVFLYQDETFFNIQQYEGIPSEEDGIPTSDERQPVIVLWAMVVDPEQIRLVYETGDYISFQTYQAKGKGILIKPVQELGPGLYCLQKIDIAQTSEDALYWCFNVNNP